MTILKITTAFMLSACLVLPVSAEPWESRDGARYDTPSAQIGGPHSSGEYMYISVDCNHYGEKEINLSTFGFYKPRGATEIRFDFYGKTGGTSFDAAAAWDGGWGEFSIKGKDAKVLIRLFKKYSSVEFFLPQDVRRVKYTLMGFTAANNAAKC